MMEHFLRPEAKILPESAMVPEENLVSPPTEFTHEIVVEQPFYFATSDRAQVPDGVLPAKSHVVLSSHDGGPMCYVVDRRGLRMATAFEGLRSLNRPPGESKRETP